MNTAATSRLGRNDPCHCGSGRKYKQCCLTKDEAAAREARQRAAVEAPGPAEDASVAKAAPVLPRTNQPWKKSALNTRGFKRMSTPRKVGGG